MPMYFFDITDNGKGFPDTEGTELIDLEAAREEALASLGEIARESYQTATAASKRILRFWQRHSGFLKTDIPPFTLPAHLPGGVLLARVPIRNPSRSRLHCRLRFSLCLSAY